MRSTTSAVSPAAIATFANAFSSRGARRTAEPGTLKYTCTTSRPSRRPVLVTGTRISMPESVTVASAAPYSNVVYDNPNPNG